MKTEWKRRVLIACSALVTFSVWGFSIQSGILGRLLIGDRATAQSAMTIGETSSGDVQVAAPELSATRMFSTLAPPPTSAASRPPAATATQHVIATATPTPSPQVTHTASRRNRALSTPLPSIALTLTPPPEGRYLVVDQDRQVMLVYENGRIIRIIPVSTGAPYENSFTPAWRGVVGPFWGKARFRNSDLWADYIWYLFPGASGSILIHSVPYVPNGEEKIYDRLDALGVEPASKGCVRIAPEDAQWLAAWNPVGVPIEITPYHGVIKPASMAPSD
ncbi:MAG: L,D-transpeptidase family protein [Anaerolineae bacterium]|nr:L,D-transpeptidase family protein [Anaerolineae bacterium]